MDGKNDNMQYFVWQITEPLPDNEYRETLIVSTLNVRTLTDDHRKEELAENFKKYGLELPGIQ